MAAFNLHDSMCGSLTISDWDNETVLELYPIFCALGVGALSGSRLVDGRGRGALQAMATVMLATALVLSVIYLLQNYPEFLA